MKNPFKHFGVVAACFTLWMGGAVGCTKAEQAPTTSISYPYEIVTTVGMVQDIVAHVAGEQAKTRNIIGEGVDPHLYKPTRNDVNALLGGDVVFYAGLMLEGKMADVLVKVAVSGKPVFAVTELIDEAFLLEPAEFQGHYDPHVWMDPLGWKKAVEAVADCLSEYDPKHAKDYKARAQAYMAQLDELNAYVKKAVATIPAHSRVLVTAHDAFNYFGRAFDIEVKGIQGLSTESEAGLRDINQLVDLIVERQIQAVFVETSVAEKNVKALIEGARSRGRDVRIGGSLFSDAMGPPGTYEGTYLGMIDHNATTVTRALGGNAPVKGWQGLLGGAAHDEP